MIALLRGRLASIGTDQVIIDTGGVGYLVICASRTLQRLPPAGGEVELRIHTQVREDSITLYGFLDAAEQHWFRLLQGIQGVGARLALALLSALDPREIALCISAQDRTPLTRATGVGPKLAGRIVAELKDRVGDLPPAAGITVARSDGAAATPLADDDTIIALVNLGYARTEAFSALMRVKQRVDDDAGAALLIRESLKELSS